MNLAWCMIALSLVNVEDPQYGTPPPASRDAVGASHEANVREPRERWPMNLSTAIRIAFDNSEDFRLIQMGISSLGAAFFPPLDADGPITIARVNADVPMLTVKANAMALVRSVEQAYWNLGQAQAALEGVDEAVATTRTLLQKEQAKLNGCCRGGVTADVAEAAERLQQFDNDKKTRTDNVKTAEQALRKALGLPSSDGKQIVATSKSVDLPIAFDWDICVDELSTERPDNIRAQAIVRLAELGLLCARNQMIPLQSEAALRQFKELGSSSKSPELAPLGVFLKMISSIVPGAGSVDGLDPSGEPYIDSLTWQRGLTFQAPMGTRSPLANTRQAQYVLLQVRANKRYTFDETIRSLTQAFLDAEDTFNQVRAARRLTQAAAHRLEVQRSYYDEGRITLDRLLDAVAQNAQAIVAEAHRKAGYNLALAALGEAKGTLLADRDITIASAPKPVRRFKVAQTKPVGFWSVEPSEAPWVAKATRRAAMSAD